MMAESKIETKEEVQARHRKEQRDLQSKIQALKMSVKGDKKKKKEIFEAIEKMEKELNRRQMEELQCEDTKCQESDLAASLKNCQISDTKELTQRTSKAQKRRDKKTFHEKERQRVIEAQEKENIHGARHMEIEKIKLVLKERNLMVHEIPTDGNCLYCAVDHQLKQTTQGGMGVQKLRHLASQFLLAHFNDYLPFLSHPGTGSLLTKEQYEDYCYKIAHTTAWGGEIELHALSHVLKRPIEIIQAVGPVILIGEEYKSEKYLTLTYHRYMYGLGEHYNSVKKYEEN